MLRLHQRLAAAAELLTPYRKTVDVGTDHAYLPAFLVLQNRVKDIIACDIGEQPLENARRTLEAYGIEDKIELRISDGLKNVPPGRAEEISICGMGGTLISEILANAGWVKNKNVHLVLQPMTHSEDVRSFLSENGFIIDRELCVFDNKRAYCCISAYWTGNTEKFPAGYLYFGELLNSQQPPAQAYIKKQIDRVKKRTAALSKAGRFPEEKQLLESVISYYESRKNT